MKHPTVQLRSAGLDDETFLYRLYVSSREAELASWGLSEQQQQIFFQMQYHAQQAQYHSYPEICHEIVLCENEPVGHIFTSQMGDQIRLVDITLLPAFQNRGIGTYLLKKLFFSATKKALPITLHVTIDNPARGLYERLGFYVKETVLPYLLMEWRPKPHEE
jgi:ribosomal protein S18 acetylase RimI-like enzyme